MLLETCLAVTAFAHSVLALASFNPIDNGPSYSVGIPSSSSISSSATGPLYLSLSAPSTYQWVGLGIGSQMAGATIFVMYPDGKGNVTISARDGKGHVQPLFDSSIFAGVELLAGSGISGGVMTANVRCTTCKLDSSSSSTRSPWISAWQDSNNPTGSSSETFNIRQHDDSSYAQFTFDLTSAPIASDVNPFVVAATTGTAPAGTSTGSSPSASSASGGGNNNGNGGGSTGGTVSSGSGSSSSGSTGKKSTLSTYEEAHGIIMAATFLLLLPIGAIMMRVMGSVWLHAAIQMFGLAAIVAGFGLGVYLAQKTDYLFKNSGLAHTIFGTTLVGLFLFQPFLGLLHHSSYKRSGERGIFSVMHTWYGRLLIIGGVVNGGLGIKLAANVSQAYKIAYIVVAAVMAVLYTAAVLFKRKGGRSNGRRGGRMGKRDRDVSS